MRYSAHKVNPGQNLAGSAMHQHGRFRHKSEPQSTWWVVYCQQARRMSIRNAGSGARYALQTFLGSEMMVKKQFGSSLAQAFLKRQDAIDFMQEMNIIDSVMNS